MAYGIGIDLCKVFLNAAGIEIPENEEKIEPMVKDILVGLTLKERDFLKFRFGLEGSHVFSREELGHIYKMTEGNKCAIFEQGALASAQRFQKSVGL